MSKNITETQKAQTVSTISQTVEPNLKSKKILIQKRKDILTTLNSNRKSFPTTSYQFLNQEFSQEIQINHGRK